MTSWLAAARLAPGLDEGELWGTAAAREVAAGGLPFPFATALAFCSLFHKAQKRTLYIKCAYSGVSLAHSECTRDTE